MSLKDRLKNKKNQKENSTNSDRLQLCEFNISVKKVIEAINNVKNPEDLGNILKEFSKILNTLAPENSKITFSGNFDLAQKTLLTCILSNFLSASQNTVLDIPQSTEDSKLIRKRKSVRAKLKKAIQKEELDETEDV